MKNKKLVNYKKGAGWRGKKRPEHSKLMKTKPCPATFFTKATIKKMSKSIKKAVKEGRVKTDNFRGHHHTEEAKKKISIAGIGRVKTKKTIRKTLKTKMERYGKLGNFIIENNYSRVKRGHYDIDGVDIYFRSMWEANYALYLNFLIKQKQIKSWEFEVETFWFEKIRRGVRSYTPDFRVINNDDSITFHEVKGWMDAKSKTKIRRMARYYPEVKLIVIDGKSYKDIIKKAPLKFYE